MGQRDSASVVGSVRARIGGGVLAAAAGFALAVPFMAVPASAAPAAAQPFANPAHDHAARVAPAAVAVKAAPAAPAATPVHTFHPVAGAPDAPQDITRYDEGCHSTNPDGGCTLRAAVMVANHEQAYDAIVLTAGTYPLSIAPSAGTGASTGDLDITDPATVTITGAGVNRTFVDGAGMSPTAGTGDRIFRLEDHAMARMTGFTIQHGSAVQSPDNEAAGYGGGIDVGSPAAALVLTSMRIRDNAVYSATTPPYDGGIGGGVYNAGSLWASKSEISGNTTDYDGGGLFVFGSTQLVDVAVTGNTAAHYGGGIYNWEGPLSVQRGSISGNHIVLPDFTLGKGGGIYIDDATTLVGTTISGNTIAGEPGVTDVEAQGGGLANDYGLNQADRLTIENNTVSGTSDPGDTCCGDGGGGILDNYGFTLTNSTLRENKALSGNGGGIYNAGNTEHLSRVTISGNSAAGSGGGIMAFDISYISQSALTGNTAGRDGGGLWSSDGQQIDQSLISGNTAVRGAGIYNTWIAMLTNDTLAGNVASGAGGGFYNAPYPGGGSSAQLTNVTISNNRSDDGGGIAQFGGGLTVHNTIIAGNKDTSGSADTNCDITSSGASALTSAGNNLDSGHTCALNGPGDKSGVNPKLGALANNGGPTKTQALLKGSPAINAGGKPAPAVDQRGVKRDNKPDIGAFEKK